MLGPCLLSFAGQNACLCTVSREVQDKTHLSDFLWWKAHPGIPMELNHSSLLSQQQVVQLTHTYRFSPLQLWPGLNDSQSMTGPRLNSLMALRKK